MISLSAYPRWAIPAGKVCSIYIVTLRLVLIRATMFGSSYASLNSKKISQDVDWLVYVTDVWRPFTTLFPTKCATRGDISGAYSLSPEVNPSRHARFSPDDCQCQFFCLYSLIIYLRAFFSFERRYRKIYTYFMIYVFPFRRIYSSLQIFQIFQTFRLLYPQAFFCISCTWTIRNYESNPLFILSR